MIEVKTETQMAYEEFIKARDKLIENFDKQLMKLITNYFFDDNEKILEDIDASMLESLYRATYRKLSKKAKNKTQA